MPSALQEPAISASFCDETLRLADPLIVEDTTHDSRFRLDPQVTGAPHVRFFAGAPLVGDDGKPLGILCAIDMVPRVLTSEQEEALELIVRQLKARMELKRQRAALDELMREKERSSANLRASEELFRAFMNASPFLSYIKDAAGRLLFYNRSFARRFGVSEYAWLGRADDQLWSRSTSSPMRMHDLEIMAGGRMVEAEEKIRGVDGTETSWKTYKFPCHDSAGNILLAGVAVDITEEVARKAELERFQEEMQEVNDQLRRLSVTDELTGLRNRRAFEERLVLEFSMARRRKRDLAVLLLDVDNFKKINDQWGHGAGDAVLRRLSAILRTTVRLPDLVARYGGEEFVMLLPESGVDAALGLARPIDGTDRVRDVGAPAGHGEHRRDGADGVALERISDRGPGRRGTVRGKARRQESCSRLRGRHAVVAEQRPRSRRCEPAAPSLRKKRGAPDRCALRCS